LESSSIEAGRFVIRRRPVDLHQIVANALQMVRPLLERRQQPLTLTEPPVALELNVDGPRLTQVLINLLTNASKYSPIGAPITLLVEIAPAQLRFTVADRGPGVPATAQLNLFHNFVRADNTEDQYGVGLGLYVVKTTVEAHGGGVGVDPNPEGGARFWVELPFAQGEAEL
jgi:signal transduction histidine kinase